MTSHQQPTDAELARRDSNMSAVKGDLEEREYPPEAKHEGVLGEDKDQVGYATFMAAQERGYEPVSLVLDPFCMLC
jgi:hypothetical protein